MDLVKSTTGSMTRLRGFALVVIVGRVKNYVIDSGVVMLGSRLATSSANIGSEISASTKK
jgi:hypothetical protein